MTRSRTFALLTGLYVSQFLGVGFFYTALTAILRDRGASLQQLSGIQVLGLFWAVKFLWAPLLDRYGSSRGHYRSWLIVLQPAVAVAILAMIGLDPLENYATMLVLGGIMVLLSATQDIAADAIAVKVLDVADRGLGNGIQIAGSYLGNILGGGAVLLVYDAFGWATAILALALFTGLPAWQVWRYREPTRAPAPEARPGLGILLSVFRQPGVARWALVLLPLLWFGVTSAYALVTPMLVDAGWSLTRIGVLTTIVAGSIALLAALGSGAAVARWGRRTCLLWLAGIQVPAILALLPLAAGTRSLVLAAVAVCVLNAAYAGMSTVVYTINMDHCREGSAGSDFTMLTTVSFAASLVAGALALTLAGTFSYSAVLVGSATLVVIATCVAARLFTHAETTSPAAQPVTI